MNKSQSAGMYIVLAIVVILFVSSVFVSGPTTKVSEISYSNFLERLDKGEFKKIEKSDDFLVAIPKVQPEAANKKTVAPTMNNPFGVPETAKAPTLKYKVLTPTYDPELMKRLDASDADIQVTRASESSKTIGNLLSYLLLPILFLVFLAVKAALRLCLLEKVKQKCFWIARLKQHLKMLPELMKKRKNWKKLLIS